MNAHDIYRHFVYRAWYWRRLARDFSRENFPTMREWCLGHYAEAREAMKWIKQRSEAVL